MKKVVLKKSRGLLYILIGFSVFAVLANLIAHYFVFKRVDYEAYNTTKYVTYADVNQEKYPREEVKMPSGENTLTGYLYGGGNTKGLLIISPGHGDANDIKLYETLYFVDAGWQVLCYDDTGCYTSEGHSMIGYSQCVHDLDAVLGYVESEKRFKELPVVLFGHSKGAYASAAVLQYPHEIKAAVVASGFDTPEEQWSYSIQRYTNVFHYLLMPYTKLYIAMQYGKEANLSAVKGINSVDIPVLVISGTEDIFYGAESPIYKKRNEITNANCTFWLMNEENHQGHYDYFLTDAALDYEKQVDEGLIKGKVDKWLYMQHDEAFMDKINDFLQSSL